MTLRELGQSLSLSFDSLVMWFADLWSKLTEGRFLDLTIGQALLLGIVIWCFAVGIYEDMKSKKEQREAEKAQREWESLTERQGQNTDGQAKKDDEL